MRRQIAKLLETAIARLPDTFRPVFVLREIEGLSVEDTAEALQIPEETVKNSSIPRAPSLAERARPRTVRRVVGDLSVRGCRLRGDDREGAYKVLSSANYLTGI